MKECKAQGARVLAIVNVVGSTIAKLADDVLYTWAGPEIAVAPKGHPPGGGVPPWGVPPPRVGLLASRRGRARGPPGPPPCLVQDPQPLTCLPWRRSTTDTMTSSSWAGTWTMLPAWRGPLKLKEISYLHSEAYAAGELKHGTIALIEKDRPVIALACYERLFDKMMSNIKEVKARGAQVLAVALEGNRQIFAEADDDLRPADRAPL